MSETLGSIYFLGNATTLIRYGDLTLLTDPNFLHAGQRAYLGYGLFTRRLHEPAIGVDELPALDGVVLSHLHGDHWDRTARRGLRRDVPIVTTPHAARRLGRLHRFSAAVGLSPWQSETITTGAYEVRITSLPGVHARGVLGLLLPPVMGSLLEFGRADSPPDVRVYVTGDTLMGDDVRLISRTYPGIDLAVVHLGGTKVAGMTVTMDGRQGAELLDVVRPREAMPIHYDDYRAFRSPLSDFRKAIAERGVADRVRFVERGGALPFGPSRDQ